MTDGLIGEMVVGRSPLVAYFSMEIALDPCHADVLYDKLERKVLPCYYKNPEGFIGIMRQAIALNGGFFNTQRMMAQYLHNAYRLVGEYLRCE
ncbi:MAG: hypothetical protein HC794_08625 [Nitrospiraceae bacterium]|nr:hypothetical protein [Nitrospiraceae bacterium]